VKEYTWTALWGVIADADDADVGTEMTVVSKDGTRKQVIVEAVQYYTSRNGRMKVKCLVEELVQ